MANTIIGINYQVDFTNISTNIVPTIDNTDDIGTSSKRWKTFYITGIGTDLIPSVNNTYNLGSSGYMWNTFYVNEVGSNLIPKTDNTYDLGSSSKKWKDLYLAGSTIYIGTNGKIKYNGTASKVQFSNDGTNFDSLERHTMSDLYDNSTSGTVNFNNGVSQRISINGASLTITFSNEITGRIYVLKLEHTVAGAKTITWPVSVKWAGSVVPVYSITLNAIDLIALFYDGTYFYATSSIGF